MDPSYSPDGTRIVYSAYDGNDMEIYTVRAEPPNVGIVQRVTNTDTWESAPCYASDDGTKIAYMASDGNDMEIFTTSYNGGPRFNVTNNDTYDAFPTFSRFGPKIGFLGRDDGNDTEIYSISPTGENRQQWTNNATSEDAPNYSPTGTNMVYAASDGSDQEIYRVHRPRLGKFYEPVQITNNFSNDAEPVWSPNSQEIAYAHWDWPFSGIQNYEIYTQGAWEPTWVSNVTLSDQTSDREPSWQSIPRWPSILPGSRSRVGP